ALRAAADRARRLHRPVRRARGLRVAAGRSADRRPASGGRAGGRRRCRPAGPAAADAGAREPRGVHRDRSGDVRADPAVRAAAVGPPAVHAGGLPADPGRHRGVGPVRPQRAHRRLGLRARARAGLLGAHGRAPGAERAVRRHAAGGDPPRAAHRPARLRRLALDTHARRHRRGQRRVPGRDPAPVRPPARDAARPASCRHRRSRGPAGRGRRRPVRRRRRQLLRRDPTGGGRLPAQAGALPLERRRRVDPAPPPARGDASGQQAAAARTRRRTRGRSRGRQALRPDPSDDGRRRPAVPGRDRGSARGRGPADRAVDPDAHAADRRDRAAL
ncbi:MAG: hypothetical protein AVDCRST_MAG66-4020, partial [uncultured Pseudonocardia sp.]